MPKKATIHSPSDPFFENRILRVKEVAELLQLSKWTIYRYSNEKRIPSHKKGKTLFFMSHEILEWITHKGAA